MKGRLGTKRGNKERKGRRPLSFSTPVVCPLTLSSFLLVCQSICICLSTNKKDRDWRDLWIIILCSPCDTEKLIGSQMGRWVCLCVWEKGLEKYIFIHLYTCIATFIFLVNASVPASRNTHVQTVCTSVSAFLCASTAYCMCALCTPACILTDTQEGVSVRVCVSHFLFVEIRGRRRAALSGSWKWNLSRGTLPFFSPHLPLLPLDLLLIFLLSF